jgi:DNA ligase 1
MTELEPWAQLCERLAGTTKKLEKRAWMADYLRELPVEAAAHAALYLAGTPFAEADRRQLNVGGASLWQVVKELTRASDAAMQEAYRRHGDMVRRLSICLRRTGKRLWRRSPSKA